MCRKPMFIGDRSTGKLGHSKLEGKNVEAQLIGRTRQVTGMGSKNANQKHDTEGSGVVKVSKDTKTILTTPEHGARNIHIDHKPVIFQLQVGTRVGKSC